MDKKRDDNYVNTVLMILASFCTPLLLMILYGGDLSELWGQSKAARNEFIWMLAGAVLLGTLAHGFLRHYFAACVVSGVSFSLLVMVLAFLRGGATGAFSVMALLVDGLIGFAAAAPVGLIFHIVRK